jgi:hypothetical protein
MGAETSLILFAEVLGLLREKLAGFDCFAQSQQSETQAADFKSLSSWQRNAIRGEHDNG